MLLYDLKEGQYAIIKKLNTESSFSDRLRDMGFCEGEKLRCVKKAVMGSPVLYFVKGAFIALRKSDAKRMEVEL